METGALYNMLKHAHSGLRWVVLILLIYAIYNAWNKRKNNVDYTQADRKLNMFAMISTHVQLLIGFIIYFLNPFILAAWSHLGAVMKDSHARHMVVEHFVGMLIAIVLITIGHAKSKRATTSGEKHKKILVFYAIALIIILASIPWPFRFEGATWF